MQSNLSILLVCGFGQYSSTYINELALTYSLQETYIKVLFCWLGPSEPWNLPKMHNRYNQHSMFSKVTDTQTHRQEFDPEVELFPFPVLAQTRIYVRGLPQNLKLDKKTNLESAGPNLRARPLHPPMWFPDTTGCEGMLGMDWSTCALLWHVSPVSTQLVMEIGKKALRQGSGTRKQNNGLEKPEQNKNYQRFRVLYQHVTSYFLCF